MRQLKLSFCIPVMNRLPDLQATLRKNLEDNRDAAGQIEFIVACFDKDRRTQEWIAGEFPSELKSGYLRFIASDRLQSWHFGRAKNAFRGIAKGRIYSSLDGDNFTGPSGARHIIEVFEANGHDCVFHQFQGDWGDGTCGRVSMTLDDYEEIGYDSDFLPRQWDELDAMLSILVRRPTRRYVCYQGKSIIRKSQPFRRFLEENGLQPATVEIEGSTDPLMRARSVVAVGQHASSYVQDDARLKYSSAFNHLSSFFKNTKSDVLRTRYVGELVETQRSMAEHIDPEVLLGWFLEPQRDAQPELRRGDIVLVSCVRNEDELDAWMEHYRRLGVHKFFIIDDGSTVPVAERITAEDTWVWKPKCGRFRYSKAFWMECLLRAHLSGHWVLTADSDEFIELPPSPTPAKSCLEQLVAHADQQGIRYFAGFLLDLVPGPESMARVNAGRRLSRADFNRFQYRPSLNVPAYEKHNTAVWSYGEHAKWAYRIDARFRLNRAFDSLRKFPIFKMAPDVHLNQGFHDLIIAGQKRSAQEMGRRDLIPILHYKLFNTQIDKEHGARPTDAYHHETRINLDRLQEGLGNALRATCMSPFTFMFRSFGLVPVAGVPQIEMRVATHDQQPKYADLLERRAPLIIRLREGPIRQNGALLEAPNWNEALEWIRINTPFSCTVRESDGFSVLATAS